jgi:hypothetical protein
VHYKEKGPCSIRFMEHVGLEDRKKTGKIILVKNVYRECS